MQECRQAFFGIRNHNNLAKFWKSTLQKFSLFSIWKRTTGRMQRNKSQFLLRFYGALSSDSWVPNGYRRSHREIVHSLRLD